LCPTNTVMTGRYHKGDENGQTQYEYATLKAIDEEGNPVAGAITVEDVQWHTAFKESSGNGFDAPTNRVLVGRKHTGDENGQTQYATAVIKIDGNSITLDEGVTSSYIKESSGIWFKTDSNRILTGRHHSGDENGKTYYISAKVVIVPSNTEPAPKGTVIIPNVRTKSATMQESSSSFLCPVGTVMTGRSHIGDENDTTQYEYSSLKAVNSKGEIVVGNITVEDIQWDKALHEDEGRGYDAPLNRVIVGRKHQGDETDMTQYATAVVKFNGFPTEVRNYTASEARKESGGWNWFTTLEDEIITGRHHFGDENGNTYYCYGKLYCDITEKVQDKIKVVVALHSDEKYYPMNPTDFITLSRFRKHVEGGADYGYNKNSNEFVEGNSHNNEYYNIPTDVLNEYYLTGENALRNYRPKDKNSIGHDEVFLEPDDNLKGCFYPDGIVPVFSYSTFFNDMETGKVGEKREYWLFYGYDYAKELELEVSHQGDWERIILVLLDGRIQGAWLSQHAKLKY